MRVAWACLAALPAVATTYSVAPGGSDGADGTTSPWQTLQHAADVVGPGDTVVVEAGSYAGFYQSTGGTAGSPIVWSAMPGAVVDADNPITTDGINLEGASYVVVEGFEVARTTRAGLRAVECVFVTLRNNWSHDNGVWGILTGCCDDLLIEDNELSFSAGQHGVYVSNSGDRPVIRRNRIHDNTDNGIHMNGDASIGCSATPTDGVISGARVEDNVIWENGAGGGSGINGDGVQESLFQNNLIWADHASGISLYQIDGGQPSTGNTVVNNTVLVAADGRWALNIQDGSTGNTAVNNILWTDHAFRGSIDACAACLSGLSSDYNVVMDRFTTDGGGSVLTLAQWQAATGQDADSVLATPDQLFVDVPGHDYHLTAASPAIDVGTAAGAPAADLDGVPRPVGAGVDVGCYEWCQGADCTGGGEPRADAGTGPDVGPDAAAEPDATADAGAAAGSGASGCGCAIGARP
jgi:parallel beta helix pectate lyase-like protein